MKDPVFDNEKRLGRPVVTDPPNLRIYDRGVWRRVYYTHDGRQWVPHRLGTANDWIVSTRQWHRYIASMFADKDGSWDNLTGGWDPELPWEFDP